MPSTRGCFFSSWVYRSGRSRVIDLRSRRFGGGPPSSTASLECVPWRFGGDDSKVGCRRSGLGRRRREPSWRRVGVRPQQTLRDRLPGISLPGMTGWMLRATCVALLMALIAVLHPAWHEARLATVAAARRFPFARGQPLWRRVWLDAVLLAVAAVYLWWMACAATNWF